MSIKFFGIFIYLIVGIVACDKLFEKDDSHPTAIELNPVICQDSSFIITWLASEDEDFESYHLYEALIEDMSSKEMVFESTLRQDTACTRSELTGDETYYYQLAVENNHGITASSSVLSTTTDCFRKPAAIEISPIICQDSTLIITWPASEDEDFESYHLFESLGESMSGAEEIFQTTTREDTSYTVMNIERNEVRYYQLVVTNTYGNSASSQVLSGAAAAPDSPELRIILYEDNSFIITWLATRDEDFVSYALLEAFSEDMFGAQEVYQTASWDDTTYTIPGIFPEEDRYYRIETTNLCGYTSSSQVELATSALRIAFVSDRTGTENIYLMDVYGRNQREILTLPEYSCAGCGNDCDEWTPLIRATIPLFHPDGDRILFQGRQEDYGDDGIFITNLDGSAVSKRWVSGPGCCTDIEFSLGGEAYYFMSGLGALFKVNTASCSGTSFPYSLNSELGGGFSISPNGNYIAFHAWGMIHGSWIVIADVDFVNQPTQIWGPNDYYKFYYPVFTPDSEALLFYADKPTGADGLFRMALDGSNEVPLDTTINSIQQVQITPDGSGILFRKRESAWGLYTMDLNGSDQILLANTTGEPQNFQYSRDGQYICFDAPVGSRREVFIMNADGSNLTQLTTEGGYSPVIQPRE